MEAFIMNVALTSLSIALGMLIIEFLFRKFFGEVYMLDKAVLITIGSMSIIIYLVLSIIDYIRG